METTKFVLDNLLIFLNTTLISHASIYENNVNQSLPNTAMNMQSPCEIGQTYLGKTICIAEDYQTNKPPNGNIIPIFYIFEDINIFNQRGYIERSSSFITITVCRFRSSSQLIPPLYCHDECELQDTSKYKY